jgi:hypothetical protein
VIFVAVHSSFYLYLITAAINYLIIINRNKPGIKWFAISFCKIADLIPETGRIICPDHYSYLFRCISCRSRFPE